MTDFGTYLFAFVVLLSVLIFVHELGHFAVAKWCGVRVLKFSIGFGNPIGFGRWRLRFERGGTEYVLAWFPLGGFVKMLGENPDEEDDPEVVADPSEALPNKPLWQKLAIVFAGPVMNLLLPIVVFMGILAVGMPRPTTVVGSVEAGSPAAEAGLRAGDRLLGVDGESFVWWGDFEDSVRTRPGAIVSIEYERGGTKRDAEISVGERSGLDPFGKVTALGWTGLAHPQLRAVVGVADGDSAASQAGLRSGDLVVAVGDTPVENWTAFDAAYAAATSEVTLRVARGGEDSAEEHALTLPALQSLEALGVMPANVLISAVSPDSPAERGGLEAGDLIVAVDGAPVTSFASFAETVRSSEGRALAIRYARDGQGFEASIAPELAEVDVGLGIEESRYLVGISAQAAILQGDVGVDRVRNPLVAFPRAVGMTVEVTRIFLQGLGKLFTGEVSRKQVAGPIGIATIAGNAFQRGWETYLHTLVLISINLGILNLLPIPILDGGQAVLFIIEGIKRSPLSLRTRIAVQQAGLTVLMLLMGMAFWNDLSRHWSKVVDWLRTGGGL